MGRRLAMAKEPRRTESKAKKGVTSHKKGHDFERKLVTYLRRQLKPKDVRSNELVHGLSKMRPYEVDVHLVVKRGWFGQGDAWFECKDRKSTIKSIDISHLVEKARDVYRASQEGKMDFYFDRLGFASTSKFDSDAIRVADQYDVLCIEYDGKSYNIVNNANWKEDPPWLEQLK